ncbi:hypothetical protein DKX38_014581 [Salix brachista]|uniref:Trafficking protein particle complex subunit 2-like protein n=1 Tax=Salix brachista TaxID=2182728 RepID=A0A5N5LFS5_9ROSI|nr:hypothetical protein DKX38_014581 [Salix brachista]
MIVCVAVVGHQNNPLYIQSFTEADDALKLHHIVHCSLDVVDERVNNPKKSGLTLNETFLGLLYPTENYKVYGYLTNTKVKFILVTTDLDVRDADVRNLRYGIAKITFLSMSGVAMVVGSCGTLEVSQLIYLRESFWRSYNLFSSAHVITGVIAHCISQILEFFRRFHAAYVDAVSNPFHVPGKRITSRTFAERVSNIVKSFGLSSAG